MERVDNGRTVAICRKILKYFSFLQQWPVPAPQVNHKKRKAAECAACPGMWTFLGGLSL